MSLVKKCKKTDDGYPNKIFRESRVAGREPGLKAMVWNKRKKETCIQKKRKKREFKKMKRDLRTSGTT